MTCISFLIKGIPPGLLPGSIPLIKMAEEMHGGYSTTPVVAGFFFTLPMGTDVMMKGAGRVKMDEIAVYEVKEGKIIREQFFF